MPEAHAELMRILRTLEAHYRDMQDTEFTVEEGRAVHAADAQRQAPGAGRRALRRRRGLRGPARRAREALDTIDAASLDALLHPTFDPDADFTVLATGVAASPGAAKGQIVFTPDDAVDWAQRGRDVVLVRPFTEADDVHGFFAAQGILTAEGGKASHAALVARGMGKPCVAGAAGAADRPRGARRCASATPSLREGDLIAIDGSTGARDRRRRRRSPSPRSTRTSTRVLGWADEHPPARRARQRRHARGRAHGARVRRRGHRPVPDRAHVHGRRPPAEDAGDDHGRGRRATGAPRSPSCSRCRPRTSRACSRRWPGLPVTIRLLDPPLHEFLPNSRGPRRRARARAARAAAATCAGSSARSTACARSRRPTRCSAPAARGSGSSRPRSTTCRSRRSSTAGARGARAHRRDAGDTSAAEAVTFRGVASDANELWVISAAMPGESAGEPTMLEHSGVLFDYLVDATPVVATCPDATGRIAPATELPFAPATSASNGIIASSAAVPPWSEICFVAAILFGSWK